MIGVDIVHIPEMKRIIDTKTGFVKRFFSEEENEMFDKRKNRYEVIAGNFAAKEALLKAFGLGINQVDLRKISVLRKESGKPYIIFNHERYKNYKIDVSISHDNDYAIGFVVVEEI